MYPNRDILQKVMVTLANCNCTLSKCTEYHFYLATKNTVTEWCAIHSKHAIPSSASLLFDSSLFSSTLCVDRLSLLSPYQLPRSCTFLRILSRLEMEPLLTNDLLREAGGRN